MTRIVLLAGDQGTGVAAHVEATAQALDVEGLSVARVDAGAFASTGDAMALVASIADATLGEIGADPLPAEAWAELPGLGALGALVRIEEASREADVVVVDAGDRRRARDLVTLPSLVVRLLDHMLTPRLAMWRPRTAEQPAFDAVSAARMQVVRLESMLRRPSTTMRLLARPDSEDVEAALACGAAVAMLGVGVDGFVIAPFPRSSDGKGARRRAERLLTLLGEAAEGVAVWRSTRIAKAAPKGRSAFDPLARVAVLDEEQLTVLAGEDSYALDLALLGPARRGVRVGVAEGRLVLAYDGSMRWLDLPPVLQRCTPVDGVRTATGLRMTFRPDPTVWPRTGQEAS